MSKAVTAGILLALTLPGVGTPVRAQSLADVADRTAQQGSTTPSPRYGDADLKPAREETARTPSGKGATAAASSLAGASADVPREEVVRTVMPAVVTIDTGSSTGSGFFVNTDTVVTNRHVIANAVSVRLTFSDGTTSAGTVTSTARDADLALVRVDQPPQSHPSLRLSPARDVRVGEEVLAVGSALGMLQGTVTRGIVSAVRTAGGLTIVQTDAAINPGNSGGPLLNRSGAVIGITTAKMTGAESLGFAIATDHASDLLGGSTSVLRGDAGTGNNAGRSLDAAFGGASTSESDAQRDGGLRQFERQVDALARAADALDREWQRYRSGCGAQASRASGDREWFGIWTSREPAEASPQCQSFRTYIVTNSAGIDTGMRQAEEAARRAGVFPGETRAVRQKYGMAWDGWDR